MNGTADVTFEGVDFNNVHEGDQLQFVTRETGFNGRGLHSRIGTVTKVTTKTVRVICDDVATRVARDIAVLRRADWRSRDVRRVVTDQPARRPYSADGVQYVDHGHTVIALWISDPAVTPEEALRDVLRRDLPYEMEIVAMARRFFKSEGAEFSGWVVEQGRDYSDAIPNKREAMQQLRTAVAASF